MTCKLTILARGLATGVLLVQADTEEINEDGEPRFPPVYFLAWRGTACSPILHTNLLHAVGELIALEEKANSETVADGVDEQDDDVRGEALQQHLQEQQDDEVRHQAQEQEQEQEQEHEAMQRLQADWAQLAARVWTARSHELRATPVVEQAISQEMDAARTLLGYGDDDDLMLKDTSPSPDTVTVSYDDASQNVVEGIKNPVPRKRGLDI